MSMSGVELPSNRKLGLFFSAFSFFFSIYFYLHDNMPMVYIMSSACILLFAISFIKPDLLLPLNKLWMRFGLLIGMIVSPIILGIIFFGLFMPISLIMKLIGRDELHLNFNKKSTYWIERKVSSIKSHTFKRQF